MGTRERKKLGFGDASVFYLAENRGSTVCAMPGGAADHRQLRFGIDFDSSLPKIILRFIIVWAVKEG